MLSVEQQWPRPLVRLHERYGRWLPEIFKLLLTILLAQSLAQLLWLLVPVPEAAIWRPAPAVQAAAPTPVGPDPQRIAAAHLFGNYQPPQNPAVEAIENAPETRLSLTLMGILAADTLEGSRALIASQNGDEKPYSVGDDIVRGVSLQSIFPDRVILMRNGQPETLRLDKDKPSAARPVPGAPPANSGDDDDAEESDSPDEVSLSNVRDEVLRDPSKAAQYIRVQPANVGGELRGYRVYPGRDRAAFSEAGLRPGDIVTAVNGMPLSDPGRALQMLGDLSHSSSFSLQVQRGGATETVNLNLN